MAAAQEYLSFGLSDEFITEYAEQEAPFGFPMGGGNSLGELTFIGKYSRRKPDGTKERWHEVCRRCIEGMYSILKDHCIKNRTPWNELKARRSAEEAYDRMWNFKWLPPGRGLWMMGTEFVNGRKNSAALQNPLHEDTAVLTRDGWRRLGDLEGQVAEVLTSTFLYGRDKQGEATNTSKWVKAEVSHIEEQPSVEIIYRDAMGQERSFVASRNHRWFARQAQHHNWKRITSEELRSGDFLPLVKSRINYLPSHSGMQHGFFFGDGSRTNGEMEQFGSSVAVLARLFGDQVRYRNRRGWVGQCPLAWGELPCGAYLSDQRYVYGFLAGYFAADGCIGTDGGMSISSARISELNDVRRLFLDLGIEVSEARLSSTSSNYAEERELWTIRINRFDVTEDFFLKLEHRERWLGTTYGKERKTKHARVIEVRDAGVQRVLCATVPEYEQFVIDGFVLTSNCAFISTEKVTSKSVQEAILPFVRLMEMSMLGVGVGFDTKGAGKLGIHEPDHGKTEIYVIPDSREGWCDSVGRLLESYFFERPTLVFDYLKIRPAGDPIHGFGGIAAGPGPLSDLHDKLREILGDRDGEKITSIDIVDICNLIGKCVVAGNVRRSALLALGDDGDEEFLDLKSWDVNPERMGPNGWGYTSNNSVSALVGTDYSYLAGRIASNGEPGLIYLDLCREYGRLIDPPNNRDFRVVGVNPCSEQTLESFELCTLVESFPVNCDDFDDWVRTLKYAYLYGKAVTLLPTHWPESNEVMQRNRRIGCSVSGQVQFMEARGVLEMKKWLNEGYQAIVARDKQYSEWLGVRESIKKTSVKPSGTVSLVAGVTPGVHWPVGNGWYLRRIRYSIHDPAVAILEDAGYAVEPDVMDPKNTLVVTFPVEGPQCRSEREVSLWEKAHMAVHHQRYWSDNAVSVTLTFREDERDQVQHVVRAFDGQLKTVSMLPLMEAGGSYEQMPYERVSEEEWLARVAKVMPLNWDKLYGEGALDAQGERFCTTDRCEITITEKPREVDVRT